MNSLEGNGPKTNNGSKQTQDENRRSLAAAAGLTSIGLIGATELGQPQLVGVAEAVGEAMHSTVHGPQQSLSKEEQLTLQKENERSLGIQTERAADGKVIIKLEKSNQDASIRTEIENTDLSSINPNEIYPRTVSTGPLAGKYVSGHFLSWLGMDAPGPIPSEVTLPKPIDVINRQIDEKLKNNPDTPDAVISTMRRQAEVLKDVDNSNLARMSLDEYASEHLEPLIQQIVDHILLPNRAQGIMEKPGYERVGWYMERYNISLQEKYQLSDQELATFEKLLRNIDSRTLLAFIINEFFGSDATAEGAKLSVEMFTFVLEHDGLLSLALSPAMGDTKDSKGIGHATDHIIGPGKPATEANELISQLSRAYTADFTSIGQLNTPQRQTIAIILNIISNLHLIIKQADNDPAKLHRIEELFQGKNAVEILSAINNRPASLYEALDGISKDKSLSDILNDIAANTGETARQVVARYVAVGNKIYMTLKDRQGAQELAGTPQETPLSN